MTNNEKFAAIMSAGVNGKFFTVRFTKRSDGSDRIMNCRTGVTKHLRGGDKAYDDRQHKLITVYDLKSKGYRSIPLEGVYQINETRC